MNFWTDFDKFDKDGFSQIFWGRPHAEVQGTDQELTWRGQAIGRADTGTMICLDDLWIILNDRFEYIVDYYIFDSYLSNWNSEYFIVILYS